MNKDQTMALLLREIAASSQSKVAKALGVSTATINRIVKGTYPNADHVLQRVEEVFSGQTVQCPTMGTIDLGKCAETRRRPYAMCCANSVRIHQYQTCKTCPNNTEASHE